MKIMNTVCGICFEKTDDLFRLSNSFITSCAKCLKRLNVNGQKDLIAQASEMSEGTQECPICGKYFARRYSFMNHVRNHSAERKHVCRYCQKAFTQAANLRNHERIHTNERPYSCTVCQKSFTQITNLNNHLRLHTGERPFQCPVQGCDKAFAQVTNLNNHAKTHQRDKFVKCYVCQETFLHYSELSDHHRMHRNNRNKDIKIKDSAFTNDIKSEPQILYDSPSSAKIDQLNRTLHKPRQEKYILPDLNMDFQDDYKSEQEGITESHRVLEEDPIKNDESNFHICCYFDNCKKKFETNNDLNSHLNDVHGLSIFSRFDGNSLVKQYI